MTGNVKITIGNLPSETYDEFPGCTFFPLIKVTWTNHPWANQRRIHDTFEFREEFRVVFGRDQNKDLVTRACVREFQATSGDVINQYCANHDIVTPNHFALHFLYLLFGLTLPSAFAAVNHNAGVA